MKRLLKMVLGKLALYTFGPCDHYLRLIMLSVPIPKAQIPYQHFSAYSLKLSSFPFICDLKLLPL